MFVDEALPGERAGKGYDIVVDVILIRLAREPQQLGPRISEQHLKPHARQRGGFHRAAQEQVVRERGDTLAAEQFDACDR
ncbi:hypothetical protein ACVWZM_006198 [Bradyrhizobium sp. USDA 4501]